MGFRIYVRPNGKANIKRKGVAEINENSSTVEFILRHISALPYDEARAEANRLMGVVNVTPTDRNALERILERRCPTKRSR